MFHWFVGRALHRVSKSISPRILVLASLAPPFFDFPSKLFVS